MAVLDCCWQPWETWQPFSQQSQDNNALFIFHRINTFNWRAAVMKVISCESICEIQISSPASLIFFCIPWGSSLRPVKSTQTVGDVFSLNAVCWGVAINTRGEEKRGYSHMPLRRFQQPLTKTGDEMHCAQRCVGRTQQGSSDVLKVISSLWIHWKVKEQLLFLGAKSAVVTCCQYLKIGQTNATWTAK